MLGSQFHYLFHLDGYREFRTILRPVTTPVPATVLYQSTLVYIEWQFHKPKCDTPEQCSV